jgi:hypothetical protein
MKVLFLFMLVALCVAVPSQLTYNMGQNYVYNVTGIVQNNGYDTVEGTYSQGYYSTMLSVMIMQVTSANDTSYEFVMNLYSTKVSVDNSTNWTAVGGQGQPLGEPVYFTQMRSGQIVDIQYSQRDPIYYINVKVGAINAFQTAIVGVGATQTIYESDPMGNHSAMVTGAISPTGGLLLTKVFNQADFTAFPDPTLSDSSVQLNAKVVTTVHPDGYISYSTLDQLAVLSSMADNNTLSQTSGSSDNTTAGLDMDMGGIGYLSVSYMVSNEEFKSVSFTPKTSDYVSSTMFDFAAEAVVHAKANALSIDIERAFALLIKDQKLKLSVLTQIGNHLRYNPQDMHYLEELLADSTMIGDSLIRDRLFYVLTVVQNEDLLVKYGLSSSNCDIITRATFSAAHFNPSQKVLAALVQIFNDNECPVAVGSAKTIIANAIQQFTESPFPYNKSYTGYFNLGGKVAGLDWTTNLFVGTNFDCNHPYFNFEGLAEVSATAKLFGERQQAFDAKIIYGQEYGSPLADAITLSVWGREIYNHPIPQVPCQGGTYPLFHFAPGFNVQHTLWVSIIPIVFQASAGLTLNLQWGWQICPAQLTAEINVEGDASVELSGSSYTDLLLLRAGFEIQGGLNAMIVPEAYLVGSECMVGFDIDESNTPMGASVTSYYQWRHCKFLFFDCGWGDYNQHVWWSYDIPAHNNVLLNITYKID